MKIFLLAFVALDAASTWKARSGSDPSQSGSTDQGPGDDGPPAEVMAKMNCNMVIYQILAKDNAKEYPLDGGDKPISKYSSKDGACTYDATMKRCSQSGSGPETCTESTEEITLSKCDCSDPKKYNFYDKGLCDLAKTMAENDKEKPTPFDYKIKELSCGTSHVMDPVEAKMECHKVIYQILAKDNAKEYPLPKEDMPISKYSSKDGACTYTRTRQDSPDSPVSTEEITLSKCDCSDPKKYNFKDKDICERSESPKTERSKEDPFDNKMKDLVCKGKTSSSVANFLSVGLMILCSLLKM